LKPAGQKLAGRPDNAKVADSWDALASANPAKVHAAIAYLAASPDKAMPLLRQELKPVQVDRQALAAALADLDSDKFARRETAARILTQMGDAIEGDLRRALETPPSLEFRDRILGILKSVGHGQIIVADGNQLRQLRAITVLEQIGSVEAQELLKHIAQGAPDARLTREARSALQRLSLVAVGVQAEAKR
jgi:hypothetical protein